MTELLVSLAALLPIFLAVTYAGRYADIKYSAVQASRYAAMQRSMNPDAMRFPPDQLQDQARVRFFSHGLRNAGSVRSDDSLAGQRSSATPPLWRDLRGVELLQRLDAVQISVSGSDVGATPMARPVSIMAEALGLPYRAATVAHVEVGNLVNRMDMSVASPTPLSIGATTAALGDGLGSSGSAMTHRTAGRLVPTSTVPRGVNTILRTVLSLFERSAPVLGCIKPDVVPVHRLDRLVTTQSC